MPERPTSGMLPADYPMAECRVCGHWSYMAGVLDDPVCLACRHQEQYPTAPMSEPRWGGRSRDRQKVMTCVYCGRHLAWPDGFPSTMFAECWRCAVKPLEDELRRRRTPWWKRLRTRSDTHVNPVESGSSGGPDGR